MCVKNHFKFPSGLIANIVPFGQVDATVYIVPSVAIAAYGHIDPPVGKNHFKVPLGSNAYKF
jgi:hypothetical protein